MKIKTIFLSLIVVSSLLHTQDTKNFKDVSDKIKEIVKMKESNYNLEHYTYDPFSTAKPIMKSTKKFEVKKSSNSINLQTILNKRAFINNSWYSVGDLIKGYKIKSINKNSVTLSNTINNKILNIKPAKQLLKLSEEVK
jgi:hypothetical protein